MKPKYQKKEFDLEKWANEHGFGGMETRVIDERYQYRGTCKCGHKEQWTFNKELAWQILVFHWEPAINEVIRRNNAT